MKYTYGGCGIIIAVSGIWFILYSTFLKDNTINAVGWLVFIPSVLIGIVIGIVFNKFPKLGSFFLGAIGGFGLGLLLFNCVFYLTDSYWALRSLSLGLALINGVLTLYQSEHLIIHSSALTGSYFFITGIGMLAGGYDNPFLILDLIRFEEKSHVDAGFYGYFAAAFVLYAIGVFS
jgi:Domain of unknown function (DUF4203)